MNQATTNQPGSEIDQGEPEPGGDQLIAVIRKNIVSEIRVQICQYKGKRHLDIRVWADANDGGERRPTRQGIACQLERVQELRAALKLVLERMPPEQRPEIGA